MKCTLLSLAALFAGLLSEVRAADSNDWITRYKPISVDGRFAVYMGPGPIVLDAKLRKQTPKTYLEAVQHFGPAFISNLSGGGTWEWYFNDGKKLRGAGPVGESLSVAFDGVLVNSGPVNVQKVDLKKQP